jgi:uncharacterized phiE125 gp8 family phage protein
MLSYNYLKQTTAPALEPLTMAEVKLFLGIDGSTYDNVISAMLSASRQMAERYIGCSIITQSWEVSYKSDQIQSKIILPKGPLISVSQAKAIFPDETEHLISSENYSLTKAKDEIRFDNLLSNINELVISYDAGYSSDASDVPEILKQGILSNISYLYENRSSGNVINDISRSLYDFFKKPRI